MTKSSSNKSSRENGTKRVRLAQGQLIRCPLTGELIPACCCPIGK